MQLKAEVMRTMLIQNGVNYRITPNLSLEKQPLVDKGN